MYLALPVLLLLLVTGPCFGDSTDITAKEQQQNISSEDREILEMLDLLEILELLDNMEDVAALEEN